MILKNISESIYLVRAENQGRFPYSFSFLLKGDRNILLDAGPGVTTLEKLKEEINIDLVIISHTHGDHISSLRALEGTPCIIPDMKWKSVLDIGDLGRRFIPDDDKALSVWIDFMVSTLGVRPVRPTGTYGDGDTFSTGKHELIAIHTPGHTIDHFSFLEGKTGTLFSFDIDFTSFGPWYGHYESDIDSFINSIGRIREINPKLIASSHVQPIDDRIQRHLETYEEHFSARDEKIKNLHQEGLSIEEMVSESPIYGGHPHLSELLKYFEKVMIEKHLRQLGLTAVK